MGTVHGQVHGESYQCISCYFYVGRIPGGLACYAFPTGIPSEILTGEYDYRVDRIKHGHPVISAVLPR